MSIYQQQAFIACGAQHIPSANNCPIDEYCLGITLPSDGYSPYRAKLIALAELYW